MKKTEANKKQRKEGISLIVLVITIIIMIILAAAIILSLNSSNVVSKANEAKGKNDWASSQEKKAVLDADILLKKSTGETINIEDEIVGNFELSYDSTKDKIDTKYIETTGTQRKALIPEGFSYVEGTIATGMVITDSAGNEFVWVPVDDFTNRFKRTTTYNGTITDPGSSYTEPSSCNGLTTNQYPTEVAEYNAMKQSVQDNGGFYIARYEAGDGDATTKRTGTTEAHKVVSKKGAYVYNYVGWGNSMSDVSNDIIVSSTNKGKGAVYLSQQMYKGSNSVVSHLTYGVEWDAALQFISKTDSTYAADSTGAGYYNQSAPTTTGSDLSFARNNIYDMAGNVFEWTMEAESTGVRVVRGGLYYSNGSNYPASIRSGGSLSVTNAFFGFRPSLYIK